MAESPAERPRIASKLVRDKIPGNRKADAREHFNLLLAKLHEETEEIARCRTDDEITEELGDVFEVCLAIAKVRKINLATISIRRLKKRDAKGGFMGGIVQDG